MSYSKNTGFNHQSTASFRNGQNNGQKDQSSLSSHRQMKAPNRQQNLSPDIVYRSQYKSGLEADSPQIYQLTSKKDVLQELIKQFGKQKGSAVIQSEKKQQYTKRLKLLEDQIEGIMRQSYHYSKKAGQRTLDYSSLLVEKQNQVNQLERKISFLQSQLRMKQYRQIELQKQIEQLFRSIRIKNDQIQRLQGNVTNSSKLKKQQSNQQVVQIIKRFSLALDNLQRKGNPSLPQLESEISSLILSLPAQSPLKKNYRNSDQNWLENKYKKYVSYLTVEASSLINNINKIYTNQILHLKSKGVDVEKDSKIEELFGKDPVPIKLIPEEQKLLSYPIQNDLKDRMIIPDQRMKYSENVSRIGVQIPVQDTRTKALIKKLASEMKRLYTKYPKLASQMTPQLSQYLSSEVLDVIQVDQLDRLVQIVKYKPDVVRVENVYNFNSQKNRKVQFHLKVLIKALLEQMNKMKAKSGIQPEIDEGVLGMIQQQVMDISDIEEIVRSYRTVPKIVEVQKIVQQVVQKIVTVPHVVAVEKNRTDIVPINEIKVVKDVVNVPLQINKTQPLIQEKVIALQNYDEKVVVKSAIQQAPFQTVTQVPKLRQVQKIVGLPQQVVNTIQIEGPQKIIEVEVPVLQNLIQQKIVEIVKQIPKIIEVQRVVEKIVPVIQQVPKIITVQRIVEKVVPQIQYLQSNKFQNIIVEKPVEVICIVQKIIPIQKIVQRIVTVPEIVEKIVREVVVEEVIKEVQIIKEVPVFQKQLLVQDRIVEKPTPPLIQQVIKQVDRIIQIPIIHEKVRVETEYRKEPIIQRESKLVREPVHIQKPVYITQQRIIQVQKPDVHLIKQQYPKQIIKQKIVPIQTVRQQIVKTPYIIEKIIEKLVEVPKIVEIERIVEKIVPVPRIIQKIVEVEKIVQKIVQKNIYHTNLQTVEYLNQIPIEVEKVVEIKVPQYIYQTKQIPKEIQVPIPIINQTLKQVVRVQQVQQPPRITIQREERPIQLIKQKIAPMIIQDHVYVDLKQQIIIPLQMPVPTTLIEQKIVPVEHRIPIYQQVQKIRQKVVQVKQQVPGQLMIRDRLVEKLFVQKEVEVVRDQIPYYNEKIKQIQVAVEKIVPVQKIIREIQQVPVLIDKVVQNTIEIPKLIEVEKIVQIPVRQQSLITIDRIVPKIVTLNKAFAQIVDKLHQFPRLAQQMKQVEKKLENIVTQKHVATQIKQAQILTEKAVIQEKLIQVDKYINVINQSLKVVDRVIEKPMDPIIVFQQKILQVPVIVQKIAERIVVMPQVVQVLKYIHEVTDNNNLAIDAKGQVGKEEFQYQRLGKNLNKQVANLRNTLLGLKSLPDYQNHVKIIDNFLIQFNKFIAFPRLVEVVNEKVVNQIVEKDKIVKVQVRTPEDDERNLASAILIDKLLAQLRKISLKNPGIQNSIDPEIMQIFGGHLDISLKSVNNFNQLLDDYSKAIFNRFQNSGGFSQSQKLMLKDYINERFELANRIKKLSKDATKYKQLYGSMKQNYDREREYNQKIKSKLGQITTQMSDIILGIVDLGRKKAIENKLKIVFQLVNGYYPASQTPIYQLPDMDGQRNNSQMREKDYQIAQLRKIIERLKQDNNKQMTCQGHSKVIIELQSKNSRLQEEISRNKVGKAQGELQKQRRQLLIKIEQLTKQIIVLQSKKGDWNRYEQQLNKLKLEIERLNKQMGSYRQQIKRLKLQNRRLKQMEIDHMKCKQTIEISKKRIKQLEEKIEKSQQTKQEQYGRNYHLYINQDNSNSISNSSGDENKGAVYRSAHNNFDMKKIVSVNYNANNEVTSNYQQMRSSKKSSSKAESMSNQQVQRNTVFKRTINSKSGSSSSHLSSKNSEQGKVRKSYIQQ